MDDLDNIEEVKILEVLDKEKYKKEFIEKFIVIFPNIYTQEKIEEIIDNNLKVINKVENLTRKNSLGEYNYKDKSISIIDENNDIVLFHEFIHVLRGSFDKILSGLEEAFCRYIETLYKVSKKEQFLINYDNDNFKSFYRKYGFNKELLIELLPNYDNLSLIIQKINILYNEINPNETLIDLYLKGENICPKIKNIYETYYQTLATKSNEQLDDIDLISMRSAYNLIYNINLIYELIFSDNINKNQEAYLILSKIESELSEIFEIISKNSENQIIFNKLLLTTKIETREERLLRIIFNEKPKIKNYSLRKALNRLSNSIIERDM